MPSRLATLVAFGILAVTPAFPQETGAAVPRTRSVQLSPWAGFDFGGLVWHAGSERSFRPAAAYGVALSVPVGERWRLTDNLGLRLEARGLFTDAGSDLRLACSETSCLFDVSGWGLWQGDVSAGLVLAF